MTYSIESNQYKLTVPMRLSNFKLYQSISPNSIISVINQKDNKEELVRAGSLIITS